MATLTIKPTQAGNDIQIKSGDGLTTHATFGNTATLGTATITNATITAGSIASAVTFPAGHVLQTVIGTKSDTNSWSSAVAFTDTGLSKAIIPASTANKVLILWQINYALGASTNQVGIGLNSSVDGMINIGDSATNLKSVTAQSILNASTGGLTYMTETISGMYLDSPGVDTSVTYKLQIQSATTGGIIYINRSERDSPSTNYDARPVSNIILMEIKG
jgi:hypothetical protein